MDLVLDLGNVMVIMHAGEEKKGEFQENFT